MATKSLLDELSGTRFLEGIDAAHLELISKMSRVREYEQGVVLVEEGEPAECVYLIVRGKVSLQIGDLSAGCKHIVMVGAGEMLGWSALTDDRRYTATAIVVEPARMICIDAERMRELCGADREFGYQIMRRTMQTLATRLKVTWTQLADLYLAHYVPVAAFAGTQID